MTKYVCKNCSVYCVLETAMGLEKKPSVCPFHLNIADVGKTIKIININAKWEEKE